MNANSPVRKFKQQLPAVGLRVKQARQNRGLTQTELAALLGVSPKGISSIEVGRVEASVSQLQAIATALKEPIGYFVGEPASTVQSKLAYIDAELVKISRLIDEIRAKQKA